jgi:hypothetical protein
MPNRKFRIFESFLLLIFYSLSLKMNSRLSVYALVRPGRRQAWISLRPHLWKNMSSKL